MMTNKEIINTLKILKSYYNDKSEYCEDGYGGFDDEDNEALDMAIKTLEQTRWIPVSDPLNELPKDRWLYVTTKVGCVETLVYDMTEWSDTDIARSTVAYMDYYEPQPYEAEREDKE